MAEANPNGANGTTSDPREQIMWDFYVSKLTKGIDNAYESAIQAGYEENTAKNITLTGWYKERKAKLKRKEMLSKAERNLDKALDTSYENQDGEIKPEVMRIVVDVSKTIAESLGKDEGYSKRTELSGKNGSDLIPKPISNLFVEKNGVQNSNGNA
jgi:hypothetical protein